MRDYRELRNKRMQPRGAWRVCTCVRTHHGQNSERLVFGGELAVAGAGHEPGGGGSAASGEVTVPGHSDF